MENNYNTPILIVDDNKDLLAAYSHLLRTNGYQVICTESGKEALALLEKEIFSLILLDVMLPDISGLEVLKIIKSNTSLDNVFVILISSLETSSASQSEGLETGADGYIVTPIQNREFLARIQAFLRHKRTMDKLRTSESEYHKLFTLMRLMSDTLPDMLWAKDMNNKFIFTNRAFCENLLNASDTSEPIGKTDLFFAKRERELHPEEPDWHTFGELCMDSDRITLREMKEMQFEEYGNIKGKFLYLDVHKAPLFNSDGELIGVVGSASDITTRKQAEEALIQKITELELFNDLTVGRELKMIELKEEVNGLRKELGEKVKYKIAK
jgi:DNA-binding response OmpR family regulator